MCKKFFMSYQKPIKGRCKFFGQRLISNDECTNFMNKENFEIVTTFDGDGGGLTPLSVLATALVALPDFLAAFPEVLGGSRLFPF